MVSMAAAVCSLVMFTLSYSVLSMEAHAIDGTCSEEAETGKSFSGSSMLQTTNQKEIAKLQHEEQTAGQTAALCPAWCADISASDKFTWDQKCWTWGCHSCEDWAAKCGDVIYKTPPTEQCGKGCIWWELHKGKMCEWINCQACTGKEPKIKNKWVSGNRADWKQKCTGLTPTCPSFCTDGSYPTKPEDFKKGKNHWNKWENKPWSWEEKCWSWACRPCKDWVENCGEIIFKSPPTDQCNPDCQGKAKLKQHAGEMCKWVDCQTCAGWKEKCRFSYEGTFVYNQDQGLGNM